MTPQTSVLTQLIEAAYKGSVFGPRESFAQDAILKMEIIQKQIQEIGFIFNRELYTCIHTAIPELPDKEIGRIIKEIGPKAVAFCPALTAGELTGEDNVRRLAAAASAIGVMYFADQSMDRGDELMVRAIEQLQTLGNKEEIPQNAATRHKALGAIQTNINQLALPEDAPIVLDCFNQQVLHNEVLLHKLSLQYIHLDDEHRPAFLTKHATQIADLMVIDAGFPSVTTSLYAIYRHNDPHLLPLSEVHNSEAIKKLLQICNAVVRIADEIGDWQIDAGHHPQWGIFSINPLNEYHPAIVTRFCELASLNDNQQLSLQKMFREFHTNPGLYGKQITDIFFNHVRDYVNNLPSEVQSAHSRYILLCKRVLEIGHVNMMGDKALADTSA